MKIIFQSSKFFLCALCIAVVAFVIFYKPRIANTPEPRPLYGMRSDTVLLVVPETTIQRGTKLSQVKLTTKAWPRTEVPIGAIMHEEDIGHLYAKESLAAGQPILKTNLSPNRVLSDGIAEIFPPGYRAITIEVESTTGIEEWALPGAHVDVFVTFRDKEDGVNKTHIVIEDAILLPVPVGRKNERPVWTLMLAVPVMDVFKVHTAQAIGTISLVPRKETQPVVEDRIATTPSP